MKKKLTAVCHLKYICQQKPDHTCPKNMDKHCRRIAVKKTA